ncbi:MULTISPECIES: universal stress protein [Brevibacterium]|uniref:Universal stress protein n=1 Tax=Brevibacterium casei TaxID=33889 RepID=A0A7T4A1J0_9MICO|nr:MULTISPECIES: universal stress protein [Brevibacterium]QQB15538.1 universal stress protein [Brevibacterium casei]
MSHTIIVGIDGSANSRCALDWAIDHAKLTGAQLRLVAAYTVPGMNMSRADIVYPADFDNSVKDSTRQLCESAAEVARQAGVPVTTIVAVGDASGVLIDSSSTADLAVVGARGHGGFSGRLLGSVALAMPAHAHSPTVVIPSTWPDRPAADEHQPIDQPVRTSQDGPRVDASQDSKERPDFTGQIVAGVDPFDTDSPVLREAAVQAQLYGKPLHIVGVTAAHILSPEWLPSEEHLTKLYDEAAAADELAVATLRDEFPDLDIRWSVFDAPATEVLVSASQTADQMIIGSRGRGGFVATLLGSTSQGVLAHSLCPTRVVRVGRRAKADKHAKAAQG